MKQIVRLFDYAVIERYYGCNPVRKMRNGQGNTRKQTAKLRKEMVDRSFDADEEAAFLALLLIDSKNQEKALATLMRYYTGLPLNQLCALTSYVFYRSNDITSSAYLPLFRMSSKHFVRGRLII